MIVTWMMFDFCFQGSAEVFYIRRSDAFAALKRYNNVLLDGKPMIIEIVGTSAEVPVSARINVTGTKGRKKRTVVMMYVILFSFFLFCSYDCYFSCDSMFFLIFFLYSILPITFSVHVLNSFRECIFISSQTLVCFLSHSNC